MNIIIAGEGKEIHFLIKSFTSKGHEVIVINKDEETCKKIARIHETITVVCGDPTKLDILNDSGIVYADMIIALTSQDPDNLIICQTAKNIFNVRKTFSIVNDPENVEIFKQLGLDTVISTTDIISRMIEEKISLEEITNLLSVEEGKVSIFEIVMVEDNPVINKKLSEINLPNDAIISCILRGSDAIIPRGNTTILAGDKLIILSLPAVQADILKVLKGSI
ncbi:MAG: TrkA family potassium uptake protein [Fusobacterium sp.]|nr:TrkA family potassium uptake protein [Fusobacterium sp.]